MRKTLVYDGYHSGEEGIFEAEGKGAMLRETAQSGVLNGASVSKLEFSSNTRRSGNTFLWQSLSSYKTSGTKRAFLPVTFLEAGRSPAGGAGDA